MDGSGRTTQSHPGNAFRTTKSHHCLAGADKLQDKRRRIDTNRRVNFGAIAVLILFIVGLGTMVMVLQLREKLNLAEGDKKIMQKQLEMQLNLAGANNNMLVEQQKELLHLTNRLFPLAERMPNIASETLGASVIPNLSSETYNHQTSRSFFWFWGKLLSYPCQNPVIQDPSLPLTPGRCWAFEGAQGHVSISLIHPVTISHVTLGHISKMQSPHGFIYSAPRKFSVYSLTEEDGRTTHLGTFEYDPDGESLQTFRIPDQAQGVFKFVKLQIESNWGDPDYTCVYNFRVHGKMS